MFANRQPQDGDKILNCGHFFGRVNFYYHPEGVLVFNEGVVNWIVCCENCFNKSGNRLNPEVINRLGIWQGNEPIIQIDQRRN